MSHAPVTCLRQTAAAAGFASAAGRVRGHDLGPWGGNAESPQESSQQASKDVVQDLRREEAAGQAGQSSAGHHHAVVAAAGGWRAGALVARLWPAITSVTGLAAVAVARGRAVRRRACAGRIHPQLCMGGAVTFRHVPGRGLLLVLLAGLSCAAEATWLSGCITLHHRSPGELRLVGLDRRSAAIGAAAIHRLAHDRPGLRRIHRAALGALEAAHCSEDVRPGGGRGRG
mmetsp:Transcript_18746/g.37748  ORF Transcript_18746/g.37748 Transcript_18746/m.37748 type:complete len:229 (-) Transcript_18746:31-717(-)